jgi:hypothetical protein
MKSLPLVDEPPCFTCTTPCCAEYIVPMSAFDVRRLELAIGVSWKALVEVRLTEERWVDSFRLDGSMRRYAIYLLRRPSGACNLLVELPGGHRRCGAHAGRPLACRIYPYKSSRHSPTGVEIVDHALCPPRERAVFEASLEALRPGVFDEMAERDLFLRAARRWDAMVSELPRMPTLEPEEYLAWMSEIYDAILPLRRGPREAWQKAAEQLIDAEPLPVLFTSGV